MLSKQILDDLLRLPEDERLFVARRLLETLPDPDLEGPFDEAEFTAELERRSNDWNDAVSWKDLKSSLV